MARYSTFKYAGQKYGASSNDGRLHWSVIVAWDGHYTGENEALRATSITVHRGRQSMLTWSAEIKWDGVSFTDEASKAIGLQANRGRRSLISSGGTGFTRYDAGVVTIILDNEDGRYDPWNASSPLYPNVKPGKFARIAVTEDGTTYQVMWGVVYDIQPVKRGANAAVRLVVRDGLQWLRDTLSSSGLVVNTKIATLVNAILTDVDWPSTEWGWGAESGSVVVQDYWWSDAKAALAQIHDLEDREFGTFFHQKGGAVVFLGRHDVPDAAVTITQSQILQDIVMPQPWEVVRNRITIPAYPIRVEAAVTLWEFSDIPAIAAGETLTYDADLKYAATYAATSPNAAVTVAGNTQPDSSGVDISGDLVVTVIGDITTKMTFSIENSGAVAGYLTSIIVQGNAVYAPYTSNFLEEDATSQADFGLRDFKLDNQWMTDVAEASGYAKWLLAKLKDPLMYPTIQIEVRTALQFGPDLADLIHLEVAKYGIDQTFRVGYIEHNWLKANGQAVRTTFKLEPYLDMATGFWMLGTSQLGVDTTLGF